MEHVLDFAFDDAWRRYVKSFAMNAGSVDDSIS